MGGGRATALTLATLGRFRSIVRLLLLHGADQTLRMRRDNKLPMAVSAMRGDEEVLRLLIEFGPPVEFYAESLHSAVEGNHEHIVELLLKSDLEVNISGIECQKALEFARDKGFEGITRIISAYVQP